MQSGLIEITIMLDAREHGTRCWPTVPHIGEEVELRIDKKIVTARVADVTWRYQSLEELGRGECRAIIWVNIPR